MIELSITPFELLFWILAIFFGSKFMQESGYLYGRGKNWVPVTFVAVIIELSFIAHIFYATLRHMGKI